MVMPWEMRAQCRDMPWHVRDNTLIASAEGASGSKSRK